MNRAPRYTGPFIRGGGGLVALLSPCLLALISVTTEWVVNHLFRQQSASTVLATNR
jgi:cytochrome c biogenesis protein CcdA